jgi:hypothetical protein
MNLVQIIYASQPFGFDESVLAGILLDARRFNQRDGITGALVCRADIYLQMLEGPEAQVMNAMDRIRGDDRHLDIRMFVSRPLSERVFGEWEMLHDPAKSWLWTRDEIAAGALERATEEDVIEIFQGLADRARADLTD